MKRLISLMLAWTMLFSMTACGSGEEAQNRPPYKIGIITGEGSQSMEEYQTAQSLKDRYGSRVVTVTYPDGTSVSPEKISSIVSELADDPDMRAIIFVQAVNGAAAAIAKAKAQREDILFIAGVCAEAPAEIAAAADLCLMVDEISMGDIVIGQAAKMGAKTFVNISIERHQADATTVARQNLFRQNCDRLGIEYMEVIAPDPTDASGVSGAQAWITENVEFYVEQYGKDTAFFCSNCAMQAPLILQCAELGAIFPLQCCPSPYHGYPEAFRISAEGHENDIPFMLEQITGTVEKYGNTGRMSTWEVPVNVMMIEAGFSYAEKWITGEISKRCDESALQKEIRSIAGEDASISQYVDETAGELPNFFMILCPFYVF